MSGGSGGSGSSGRVVYLLRDLDLGTAFFVDPSVFEESPNPAVIAALWFGEVTEHLGTNVRIRWFDRNPSEQTAQLVSNTRVIPTVHPRAPYRGMRIMRERLRVK